MKRISISIVFLLLLIPAFAFAEVDLSGMSYDDLVSLSKQVGMAIMQSEEFDSVTVPKGIWEVGVDIPEGTWIITPANQMCMIAYGKSIDESGNDMSQYDSGNSGADLYNSNDSWRLTAKSGNYICVKIGPAVFTSDTGSTGLGFKKK